MIFYIATSCKKSLDCCTNVDIGISIRYIDIDSINILNSANGLQEDNIKIFHKIEGNWERAFDTNMDLTQGIYVYEREGENYLMLFPSTDFYDGNFSETMIEFSDNDFDIVKTQFDLSNGNLVIQKVWYNDVLKWESYNLERSFDIVK